MSLAIYKPDQGYWTRTMSAAAFGVIGLAGGAWLYQETTGLHLYARGGMAAAFMIIVAALIFWVFGTSRRAVEFFIATEGELKKVNWSTRREIMGSTWVVVIVAVAIAATLFIVDIFFKELFSAIGILTGGSLIVEFLKNLFN
ncbi:MAG: preprotein translocase subunit SecE [Phycisphaerales bacterium]|nr:preprotein translocase subunit SecE [Phycisphaerales bacterium]